MQDQWLAKPATAPAAERAEDRYRDGEDSADETGLRQGRVGMLIVPVTIDGREMEWRIRL